jgi:putative ABC transport system permease protein
LPASELRQLFVELWQQRLRTVLTLLGLVWGTVGIILLMSVSDGFYRATMKSMHGMGRGICIMWGSRTAQAYNGLPPGRYIHLQREDIEVLREQIRVIANISPEYSRSVTLRRGRQTYQANLSAVYPEFATLRNIIGQPQSRFLNARDMQERRRVAFIGDKIKNDLFGDSSAIGSYIQVDGSPFLVIGVLQPKNQSNNYNGRDDRRMFIPSTAYEAIYGKTRLSNMVFKADRFANTEHMKNRVYAVMSRLHKFDPADREALAIWDTTGNDRFFATFFGGMIIFLGIVGSMTLIVAGIGLSNIMYIVVEERSREIGIKRALGARRTIILRQFIYETLFISLIGGSIGFAIARLFIWGLNQLQMEEYFHVLHISSGVALSTVAVLALISFLAGWFPARKAASIEPVQAIRYGG